MPSLRQRFLEPAKARPVEDATVDARCAGPLCGDHVRVSLRVDEGVIRRAGFEASGCPLVIAASDVLCEAVEGVPAREAARVAADRLREELGHLGPNARTCGALPLGALEEALALLLARAPARPPLRVTSPPAS